MDTWTVSTSQAIPDFCRSKVGPRPSRGRFGALRGWGGKKSTSRNLILSYSKWVHRLPYGYTNAFQSFRSCVEGPRSRSCSCEVCCEHPLLTHVPSAPRARRSPETASVPACNSTTGQTRCLIWYSSAYGIIIFSQSTQRARFLTRDACAAPGTHPSD